MRTLYIDCSLSGISGDMMMGALVHIGADLEAIEKKLVTLPIEPISLHVEGVMKKGIYAKQFSVIEDEEARATDHRHYSTIRAMIEEAPSLTDQEKERSLAIFEPIAASEAKIHNEPLEKVHFHEVGAVDSIVDIVGTAIALEQLQIDTVIASPVAVGGGTIEIDHGTYPVPAPATLDMLTHIPIAETKVEGELTTPTGAGFLKGLVTQFGPLPSMTIEKVGYGAGTKDFPHHPNVLRLCVGYRSS